MCVQWRKKCIEEIWRDNNCKIKGKNHFILYLQKKVVEQNLPTRSNINIVEYQLWNLNIGSWILIPELKKLQLIDTLLQWPLILLKVALTTNGSPILCVWSVSLQSIQLPNAVVCLSYLSAFLCWNAHLSPKKLIVDNANTDNSLMCGHISSSFVVSGRWESIYL